MVCQHRLLSPSAFVVYMILSGMLLFLFSLLNRTSAQEQEDVDDVLSASLTHNALVEGATWTAEGSQIISWTDDNTIYIWDMSSGTQIEHFTPSHSFGVVEWNRYRSLLAIYEIYSLENDLEIWNVETDELVFYLANADRFIWSNEGSHLISVGRHPRNISLWNIETNEVLYSWEDFRGVNFSEARGQILLWSDQLLLIDIDQLEEPIFTVEFDSNVRWAGWNGDGSQLLVFVSGMLQVLDANVGQSLYMIGDDSTGGSGLSVSPDERLIGITPIHANTLIIYEFATGEELFQIDLGSQWHYFWSPDGTKLATLNRDGILRIWDASNGDELFAGQYGVGVIQASWSPTGGFIFSRSRDGRVVLWDMDEREAVFTRFLPVSIDGFQWQLNSERLLVWSDDRVEIWDFTQADLVAQTIPDVDLISAGQQLAEDFACLDCHKENGAGPSFVGIYNRERIAEDGEITIADEEYLAQSILNPSVFIVNGYLDTHPTTYNDLLLQPEVNALVAYIVSLSE